MQNNLEKISVTEVLDRVLDHGIVMEPSSLVFLLGADLRKINAKFVVESVKTYL